MQKDNRISTQKRQQRSPDAEYKITEKVTTRCHARCALYVQHATLAVKDRHVRLDARARRNRSSTARSPADCAPARSTVGLSSLVRSSCAQGVRCAHHPPAAIWFIHHSARTRTSGRQHARHTLYLSPITTPAPCGCCAVYPTIFHRNRYTTRFASNFRRIDGFTCPAEVFRFSAPADHFNFLSESTDTRCTRYRLQVGNASRRLRCCHAVCSFAHGGCWYCRRPPASYHLY